MKNASIEADMEGTSLDITQDLIQKLKTIIPGAFTEDKINVEQLKKLLGEGISAESERYHLSWAGKSEAFKVLQTPTAATLIPQPEQSVNWDKSENIFIEGENLEVLKVIQKYYYGKVKMIYIDPPYNTGSDSFIYPDKFSETKEEYLKRIGEKDEEGYMMKEGLFRKNSKENGQFHSNWLNMMMPRLFLARNLLREDGVIFISIDDNEQSNLRMLMDEIFGEENFIATLSVKLNPRGRHLDKYIAKTNEYILVYVKDISNENAIVGLEKSGEMVEEYDREDDNGVYRLIGLRNRNQAFNPETRPTLYYPLYVNPANGKVSLENNSGWEEVLPITNEGVKTCWTWGKEKVQTESELLLGELSSGGGGWRIYRKDYLVDSDGNSATTLPKSLWIDKEINNDYGKKAIKSLFGANVMSFPKSPHLIKKLVEIGCNKDDIVLDFFGGSGTLAQSVIELNDEDGGNRKYILVQLPELLDESSAAYKLGYKSISEIAEARIKKVIEQVQKDREGKLSFESNQILGFRKYTLAPSNFKIWRGDVVDNEDDLARQMEIFITPQRANAQTENILWELLIKNGVSLTENIEKIEVGEGAGIYHTTDKRFAFVLDKYIPQVQEKVLQLKPKTVICLDSLFQSQDMVKTNAQLKFEDNGITFKTV